jgi:hypothetical protein
MMGSTQSRGCAMFSHWLVFSPPTTVPESNSTNKCSNSKQQSSFSKNITSHYQPTIITFVIRGHLPLIYFKFISQFDDFEYQKTSHCH